MRPVDRIEIRQTVGLLGFHPVEVRFVSKPRLDEFVFRVYALMKRLRIARYEAVERTLYGW